MSQTIDPPARSSDPRPHKPQGVGAPLHRVEDRHLVTGRTQWAGNVRPAGTVHAVFVRSVVAHARFTVDTTEARTAPGVLTVWTSADHPALADGLPGLGPAAPESLPPLAVGTVRYVGQPVAVVVARTAAEAADAADLVDVDYEELPVLPSLAAALAADAPLVHEGRPGNQATREVEQHHGDVEAALAAADVVVTRRFVANRVTPGAMEPRAAVVAPDGDGFTAWVSTQTPHIARFLLAKGAGLPEDRMRVVAQDVGGGFGGKFFYPEEFTLLLLVQRLGVPVAWTATRSEDLATTFHGRALEQEVTVAATRDGVITGLDVRLYSDVGAYTTVLGTGSAAFGMSMYPGIYKVPAYRARLQHVFTNKVPVGAYRGAGRPEATFALERIMDELAAELGVDPVDVRRRNWVPAADFPYVSAGGNTYDVGDFDATTDRAVEMLGLDGLRARQAAQNTDGAVRRLGIGVATYIEACGGGGIVYDKDAAETSEVRLTPAGGAEVVVGTTSYGMGHLTAWAQIVSEVLDIDVAKITVVQGDTARARHGYDSYGSRSLSVAGSAIHRAAVQVRENALRLAAHLLEAAPEDVGFADGVFSVRGTDVRCTLAEVAHASYAQGSTPGDAGLGCVMNTDLSYATFPFGAHLAVVEVDVETGAVDVVRYVAVDDVGNVVNPMIVDGQLHGGVAQGIGQALYEEVVYDDVANVVTPTIADYGMPSALDVPSYETDRCVTPTTVNPLGAKGAGECGAIAAPPAVINAVVDALRPLGVDNLPMPATPTRVWQAIRAGRGQASIDDMSG
ncbi:MAG: xanthine dehydrogenase family protein molybdopterin-binding subunit [Nocardioidaceae bacterium]